MGSVFVLVQVGLFIEVFIFWRRKAFLREGKEKYSGFLLHLIVCSKSFLIIDDIQTPLHAER